MYLLRHSPVDEKSSGFDDLPRAADESNTQWFERARAGLVDGVTVAILLLGGTGIDHFRVRIAQSVARDDLTPSHWSHVALITHVDQPWTARTRLTEIPLTPRRGFCWPPKCNALNNGLLGDYDSPELFPNIALIGVPADQDRLRSQLRAFRNRSPEMDCVSLLTAWLAYLWGASGASNPLERGMGLPSSVMVETVISAAWQDLSPGLATIASCPEAIWQAAKHWSIFHKRATDAFLGSDEDAMERPKSLTGFHRIGHRLVPEQGSGRSMG